MGWQNLLKKESLSKVEILRIPGASNENYITAKNYFCTKFGLTEESLLEGLNISSADFNDPQNWLNPLQERQFNINVFKKIPGLFTHHDYYKAGVDFQFSENSLFILLFKALPASRIIKEINRNVKKFNNDYKIWPLAFQKGHSYFIIEPEPFFREIAVGNECRFAQGVFSANFEIHNIANYTSKHLLCFQRIENIVKGAYGHLLLDYKDDGEYIFINDQRIGRHVRLCKQSIADQETWINRIDEASDITKTETPPNAVAIMKDYIWEGRTLFFQGEFYNAPYCLLEIHWVEPSFWGRITHLFRQNTLINQSLQKMSEEIEFANSKLFEAREALHQSERKSRIFQVYTRQSLVQSVDNGNDPTTIEPKEEDKVVLFNDIRGFTNLSEYMGPRETVKFLNNYFNNINEIIISYKGEIDKIIGDCIMAEFDNPDDAIKATLSCQQALQEYNRHRFQQNKPKIFVGFGINYGKVITGNIGSKSKMDFTLIGDTVNAASRLESLTKHYNTQILISGEVKKQLKEDYLMRFLDVVYVKGKILPMEIYDVYQHIPQSVQDKITRSVPSIRHAFDNYHRGNFIQAFKEYGNLIQEMGPHLYDEKLCSDPSLHFFQRRCHTLIDYKKQGLLDLNTWEGIYEFKDK